MKSVPPEDLEYILQHTKSLWSEFKGARLFITGATGFIGQWLVNTLFAANKKFQLKMEIMCLSRQFRPLPFTCVQGDVTDFDFPNGQFTHLIHAATDSCAKLNSEQPVKMFKTIVEGTQHVLEFATSVQVKKMLFLSSGAVYGKQPAELLRLPEDYPLAAYNLDHAAYAVGKHTAEQLCSTYANELAVKIARIFTLVGPLLPLIKHYAIGNFIHDALYKKQIEIKGDGSAVRSYLYIADLIIWLMTILCHGRPQQPYNVGSEKEISIRDLARGVIQEVDPRINFIITHTQTTMMQRYIPCTQLARTEFDLPDPIDLSTSIKKTVAYAKSQ